MAILDINGNKIWYKQTNNDGSNYILLHNAGGDHGFLSFQFEMLSKMGFCVTSIDFLGHGKSDMPEERFLTIASNARDVIAILSLIHI